LIPKFRIVTKSQISVLLILLTWFNIAFSQSREELERKRKQKEEEIKLTRKLIAETDEKQKKSVEYLNLLKNQIETRESIINTIRLESRYLSEEINESSEIVNSLQKDLNSLKKEYASMVRFAFKTRNNFNKLGFILSAATFNQSYKRLKLLQNYSFHRKKQMGLIVETSNSISEKIADLKKKVTEKQILADIQNTEKANLEKDKESENKVFNDLKKKEGQLKKELAEKERARNELNRKIEELIRKEIATTKKATSGGSVNFAATPEGKKLSLDFSGNKGKLPWPVEKGVVSENFGQHEHPTLKGVTIISNGVKILSPKGSEARCIFNGIVSSIIIIPGSGKTVLVNHGEYYTVYSNLTEVYVKPNDKVTTKQKIGKIRYDEKTGKTEMEIQVWNQTNIQDPLNWMQK